MSNPNTVFACFSREAKRAAEFTVSLWRASSSNGPGILPENDRSLARSNLRVTPNFVCREDSRPALNRGGNSGSATANHGAVETSAVLSNEIVL